MASVASSSSFFPALTRSYFPPWGNGNKTAKSNFLRIVTRSCLDDSSSLSQAAQYTVDTYVKSGMVIGLGSGQASGLAIRHLGQQLRTGALKNVVGIPMSVTSASEAAKAGIPLDSYQEGSQIDFAFDDADVIEEGSLIAIIGRRKLHGEESILEKKLNWLETAEAIDDMFLGDAEVWRRPSIGQAGPLGGDFPLVTKEGHNLLDVIFTSPIESLAEVAENLNTIKGVAGHGVISKFPCSVVIASQNGLNVVDKLTEKVVG
ncbi:probable ribose-5-phosphate isomerase 4, chloroplastic isoform X2 [Prosopis cineraria]|uniref:probable ribose-5-phosphate isomerase 4, chloroplastic isoform X2 n=1 Tax=Prosopis cineraria TaxID=364024 RepID=UPI00240EA371|nr:probable ribose-5-phosphate isomerase 4, chloroplastic isoform X2 [Prosopis cineraria]